MSFSIKKKLTIISVVYWFLLAYIVAALVWWFISLQQQNHLITQQKMAALQSTDILYQKKMAEIASANQRKTAQYYGEGAIFLLLMIVGALYIYRAIRRQLRLGQQQQNFMMAITHELKTPIAIATLNLETLQKRKLEDGQQQRLISNSLQETERLNDLCNNILFTAQLETKQALAFKEKLDIAALTQQCVQNFKRRFPHREITTENLKPALVLGEEMMLQLLVNNLLENATKYAPKETPIHLSIQEKKDDIQLSIADHGPGIPEGEKQKVFQKFYRIGSEQTRSSKGTGLGLYLCKKIMAAHGGHILVKNNQPNGSIFVARFRKIKNG